ncbi:hypothetical protein IMZ48_30810 [Candidatus Bathyarchaeota archaeon]|nr:hypothetical protein [Candidatus Bathyarchaeota archaeon]
MMQAIDNLLEQMALSSQRRAALDIAEEEDQGEDGDDEEEEDEEDK